MAGISFQIIVDDSEANAALSQIIGRMERRRAFYRAVALQLHASAQSNFKKQAAPDGTPWAKLKAVTIRRRTAAKQLPIQILSSNTKGKSGSSLRGSISMEADNDAARIGVAERVPYGAIHQFGGTIQIPARKGRIFRHYDPTTGVTGRKFVSPKAAGARTTDVDIPAYAIRMPARPFLGVSPEDEKEILDLAIDWLGLENS